MLFFRFCSYSANLACESEIEYAMRLGAKGGVEILSVLSHLSMCALPGGKPVMTKGFCPCYSHVVRRLPAILRIPLMADTDSTFIADSIPYDGGHPAQVS
jgi:hypothetical protein